MKCLEWCTHNCARGAVTQVEQLRTADARDELLDPRQATKRFEMSPLSIPQVLIVICAESVLADCVVADYQSRKTSSNLAF